MIWAIPDIHGRMDLLGDIYRQVSNEPKEKVVFLGDMVDRGYQSREVVAFIKNLVETEPEIYVALRGNHEDFMLKWYWSRGMDRAANQSLWFLSNNGGANTVTSYLGHEKEMEGHIEWISKLPLSYEYGGFFFSHAPAPREKFRQPPQKGHPLTEEELLWTYSRDEVMIARNFRSDDDKDLIGVCGHVHALSKGIRAPRFYPHYIFADAGCGCHPEAPLVAIEVKSRRVLQAVI